MRFPAPSIAIKLHCSCLTCGARIGIASSLIAHLAIQEIITIRKGEGKRESEAIEEIQSRIDADENFPSFFPFEFSYDPVALTLSFPGWCPNCKVIHVVFDLSDLTVMEENEIAERKN